ncbi:RNA polymerase factor sigma-54 [Chitinolyticbacter meiyuanensis]|uniref:RNA polymerase factor sigma-54 n=1 Tax=Chitinolyticbacter meiyuanensis TaxID=682798 RepID=UPI0011E5FDEF|nr:RNA polymerase factor sigma-54 [Chitinolyticbacter meiyuanensis]
MSRPEMFLEHQQHQTLTPRLQQAVRLLQLSTQDFTQELRDLLSLNPFLELDDAHEPQAEAETAATEHAEAMPEPLPDPEPWGNGKPSAGVEGGLDLLDLTCAGVTLQQHLHQQLNVMNLSERDLLLVALVIEALDDDGYLRVGLDELAGLLSLNPPVEPDEMQYALRLVQSFEPTGVACRDVAECISLQLAALPESPCSLLAGRIIDEAFQRLAVRDIVGVAQAMGCSPGEAEAAAQLIRQLDPRPGWAFGEHTAGYLTPDILVHRTRDGWAAMLNPAVVPRLKVNQHYAELFARHRESHHGDLATHLQEARWTVRNLEQRFFTILRVAQALVDRQQYFFEHGILAMQPLGLKDIAEALELHESTVSRATNNKYMATPFGVFELKYLFSRGLSTRQGSQCSTTAIREAIRKMIQTEAAHAPHSDAEITRLLQQQGLKVARRTVTKYRQLMNIPSVEQRRLHA